MLLACMAVVRIGAQPLPLAPDKAFRFSARALNPQTIEVRYSIVDGYYLYRDRIHLSVEPRAVEAAVAPLPPGKVKEDPFFGRVETYRGAVVMPIALKDTQPGQQVVVVAESQGCADVGICYPVQIQRATVVLPAANVAPAPAVEPRRGLWFEGK
jgi:thiol:disulfide interchange protein DsbD